MSNCNIIGRGDITNQGRIVLLNMYTLFLGCRMAISLGREDIDYQNQLANTNAFEQLNRLLQPQKYTKNVILMAIKVLGILCVGKVIYGIVSIKCLNRHDGTSFPQSLKQFENNSMSYFNFKTTF